MTKPSKKPAAGQWDKKALLQNLLRRSRNIFTITLPTEGMGLSDMKRNLEGMKEILGLGQDRK